MPQTSTIAFALVVGFIVFITVRGELPAYLCTIGLGSNCPTPPATTQTSASNTGTSSTVGSVAPVSTTINNTYTTIASPGTSGNPIQIGSLNGLGSGYQIPVSTGVDTSITYQDPGPCGDYTTDCES